LHADDKTMLEVLDEGLRNRQTAAHQMNDRSSRSHTILTIQMHSTTTEEDGDADTQGNKSGVYSIAKSAEPR
jgi:hypothetical protein